MYTLNVLNSISCLIIWMITKRKTHRDVTKNIFLKLFSCRSSSIEMFVLFNISHRNKLCSCCSQQKYHSYANHSDLVLDGDG
jgi:hypothetical protein